MCSCSHVFGYVRLNFLIMNHEMLDCAFVVIELFWSSDSNVGLVTMWLWRTRHGNQSRVGYQRLTSLFHLTALWKRICLTNLNLLKWNLNGQALTGLFFFCIWRHHHDLRNCMTWFVNYYGFIQRTRTREKSMFVLYLTSISMPRSSIRVFRLAIWAPYIDALSRYSLQPIHFLKHQQLAMVESCREVQHVVKGLFTSFASTLIEHRCFRKKKKEHIWFVWLLTLQVGC